MCRWAVSTVMTRQNQIPNAETGEVDTALIPLWDMCNHTNGWVSSLNFNDVVCSYSKITLSMETLNIFFLI